MRVVGGYCRCIEVVGIADVKRNNPCLKLSTCVLRRHGYGGAGVSARFILESVGSGGMILRWQGLLISYSHQLMRISRLAGLILSVARTLGRNRASRPKTRVSRFDLRLEMRTE